VNGRIAVISYFGSPGPEPVLEPVNLATAAWPNNWDLPLPVDSNEVKVCPPTAEIKRGIPDEEKMVYRAYGTCENARYTRNTRLFDYKG